MRQLSDYRFVYVGCGGTFYMGAPYYAALMARLRLDLPPIVMDPDVVDRENEDRQWPGCTLGERKTEGAARVLGRTCAQYASQFVYVPGTDMGAPEVLCREQPVLAIVNVDNDSARLDVRQWLMTREQGGIMVVSGCEKTYGQAYWGMWGPGGTVLHDWLVYHPEVGEPPPEAPPCSLQTAEANMLTATCSAMCLEDLSRRIMEDVGEYYWSLDELGEGTRAGMVVFRKVVEASARLSKEEMA